MLNLNFVPFVKVEIECDFCDSVHYINVARSDLDRFLKGELAQKAFPYLTADERELFISQICPTCWNNMFKCADDEE